MNLYIVSGTTTGLGAALAQQIAADPANELIALARAAEGPIPGGFCLEADLADSIQVSDACKRIDHRIAGRAYDKAVLINNAGVIGPVGTLDQVDAAGLERNLQVNLVAPILLMRWFLRASFLSTTGAIAVRRIVNISSGAGRRPVYGWAAYCASKAALDMASRTVAIECETRGMNVEVVSLAPGVIDTPMQATVRGASSEAFADVERFRAMKAEGALRPAADVAADILRLESAGQLKGEAVQDLRSRA